MGIAEAHPAHASGNMGHCTHGIRVFVFATQVKWICCSCALSITAKIALTEWRPLSSPSPNERTLSPRLFIWQSEPARFDTRKETSFGAFRAPFYRAPPSSLLDPLQQQQSFTTADQDQQHMPLSSRFAPPALLPTVFLLGYLGHFFSD